MSILILNSLGLTLGQPLFNNLSLTLHPGDRLGLVAANGRGKTTLLACMAGREDATNGSITRARGLITGMMAQEVPAALMSLPLRQVLLSALPPDQAATDDWRADIVMDDFAIPEALRDQPLSALSGG
jgi:ATPase subunit of ABC transporter with duplicated ATPase domains